MAREAAARLYDVEESSLVFTKLRQSKSYDIGTLAFRARRGKLIDLDQLNESVATTRLGGGTRSGLVSLEVTAVGDVVATESGLALKVAGADAQFILDRHSDDKHKGAFDELRAALDQGKKVVSVTGIIDGWTGRWPDAVRKLPPKPRRILVTKFETENQ
jgi:hypothetical protein